MKIEYLLYFYGIVCLAMIGFNIFYIVISKQNKRFIHSLSNKDYELIKSYIEQKIPQHKVDKKTAKKIKRNLLKTVRLQALEEVFDQLSKEEMEECMIFIHKNFEICEDLVREYLKKDSVKAAYFLHFLYKYKICSYRKDDTILEQLKAYLTISGIYCRHNAMLVLYRAGVPEKICEAIKILNKMDISVHERILSVGLRQYAGDMNVLINMLLREFDDYQIWIQEAICNFIIQVDGSFTTEILSILENPKYTQEIHWLCIEYLGKYPTQKAYPLLLKIVQNNKLIWKYKMYAIRALASYPSQETITVLKQMLHSTDWNIRLSAAKSLEKQKLSYYQLIDIFNGYDRNAREIMQYFLEERRLKEIKG